MKSTFIAILMILYQQQKQGILQKSFHVQQNRILIPIKFVEKQELTFLPFQT